MEIRWIHSQEIGWTQAMEIGWRQSEEILHFSQNQAADILMKNLRTSLSSRRNMIKFHAIAGKPNFFGNASCEEIVNTGWIYDRITRSSGGVNLDLCSNNWSPLFNELRNQIISDGLAVPVSRCPNKERSSLTLQLKWKDNLGRDRSIELTPNSYTYYSPGSINAGASFSVPMATLQSVGVPFSPSGVPFGPVSIEVSGIINPE